MALRAAKPTIAASTAARVSPDVLILMWITGQWTRYPFGLDRYQQDTRTTLPSLRYHNHGRKLRLRLHPTKEPPFLAGLALDDKPAGRQPPSPQLLLRASSSATVVLPGKPSAQRWPVAARARFAAESLTNKTPATPAV